MSDDHEYSVDAAREAAERDELDAWVARFLASPGSDNAPLAAELTEPPRWWLGPVQLPVDQLHRLAGPPDAPVLCPVDDDYWRDDVDDMAERIEEQWEPPPVIVTYRKGQLVLEDGNHRVEGVRRAGRDHIWAVVAFEDPDERDRFVAPRPAASEGGR
jgi:ParB-like nuclease domain